MVVLAKERNKGRWWWPDHTVEVGFEGEEVDSALRVSRAKLFADSVIRQPVEQESRHTLIVSGARLPGRLSETQEHDEVRLDAHG